MAPAANGDGTTDISRVRRRSGNGREPGQIRASRGVRDTFWWSRKVSGYVETCPCVHQPTYDRCAEQEASQDSLATKPPRETHAHPHPGCLPSCQPDGWAFDWVSAAGCQAKLAPSPSPSRQSSSCVGLCPGSQALCCPSGPVGQQPAAPGPATPAMHSQPASPGPAYSDAGSTGGRGGFGLLNSLKQALPHRPHSPASSMAGSEAGTPPSR